MKKEYEVIRPNTVLVIAGKELETGDVFEAQSTDEVIKNMEKSGYIKPLKKKKDVNNG